jgi:peptide/nickel transport system permease protein
MQRHIASGILRALVSMVAVSAIIFVLVRLSGDPTDLLVPLDATKEQRAEFRATLGLDRSWPVQYREFIERAVQGDLGRSIMFKRPALEVVMERFPATIQLALVAFLLALAIALPVGVYSAAHRGGALDYCARAFAALGQAVPPFWLGLVLILVLGVYLRVLPTSGTGTVAHLVMPAATLGWFVSVGLMRLTRSSMLNVLGTEYVKLARIKGLYEWQVIWKHAFKNAALPVLTFGAVLLVSLINGAVVVETVFSWPGVGSLVIQAVNNRDYPVVQAAVLLLCGLYVFVNLLVDLAYGYLDPKLRSSA